MVHVAHDKEIDTTMEDFNVDSVDPLSVIETSMPDAKTSNLQTSVSPVPQTVISSFSAVPSRNGMSEYFFRDYQDYESRLVYWITHTANRIIYLKGAWRDEAGDCLPSFPTTITGFLESCSITLENLLSAAELIAAEGEPIPDFTMLALKKVMEMRERMHLVQIEFMKKNMASSGKRVKACTRLARRPHWHVMAYLKQIWFTWDGDAWAAARDKEYGPESELTRLKADDKLLSSTDLVAAVQFGVEQDELSDDKTNQDEGAGEQPDKEPNVLSGPKKINLTKDGIKFANKRQEIVWKVDIHKLHQLSQECVEDFSLQIQPEIGCQALYHMTLVCLLQQASEARAALVDSWDLVIQGKLPLITAALISRVAISIVGYHEAVMNKFIGLGASIYAMMTRLLRFGETGPLAAKFVSTSGQTFPSEQILLGQTYYTLFEFITDYRVHRTGQPSQALLDSLVDPWDPNLDPRKMTDDERHVWLRTYTIRWLYDVTNYYITGINDHLEGGGTPPPTHVGILRCIIDGPATDKRRLLGLNEFVFQLIDIIFDKEREPTERILFREVFQLQSILDAFLVTRGWYFRPTTGYEFKSPMEYDPVKDIEKFFGWSHQNGFGPSFADARRTFFHESTFLPEDERRLAQESLALCQQIVPTFNIVGNSGWLLKETFIGSTFDDPNGVWQYSPLLCGTAMLEALTLGCKVGQVILDRHTEAVAYAHLQNMLREKNLLKCETPLFEVLRALFETDFFPFGIPTSQFKESVDNAFEQWSGREREEFYKSPSRDISGGDLDIGWKEGHIYNINHWATPDLLRPSLYSAYADSEYIPDAVPYDALAHRSYLRAFKSATREMSGLDPQMCPDTDSTDPKIMELLKGFFTAENVGKDPLDLPFAWSRPDIGNILYRLRCDLMTEGALSSYLNYPRVVADILNFFHELDAELKKEDNASLIEMDEEMTRADAGLEKYNRMHLTSYILKIADAEQSSEQDTKLLDLVTCVMKRCSCESTEDYFYRGFEPRTLQKMAEECMLEEKRYAPECTML